MKRKRILLFATVGGLLACGGCGPHAGGANPGRTVVVASAAERFAYDARPSDKELATRKLIAALNAGDVKTLLSLSDPDERKLLHLKASSLQSLVNLYLAERKKVHSLGVTGCRSSIYGGVLCAETVRAPAMDVAIESMVYENRGGLYALVTEQLVRGIQEIRWVTQRPDEAKNAPNIRFRRDTVVWLKDHLESKGIPGLVFLSGAKGEVHFVSWEDFINQSDQMSLERPIPAGTHMVRLQ